MRKITAIFFLTLTVAILVGCNMNDKEKISTSRESNNGNIDSLLDMLEDLGFYKYIDPSNIDEVKKESAKYGYVFGDSGRDFTSDAEDLAEGGISNFYNSIKDFLEKQNVTINITENFSDKGYSINVNNQIYIIYNEDELNTEDIWELSTVRSFAVINKLLKEAGSPERLYTLYGGNDLKVIFLDDKIFKAIIASNLLPEKELPKNVPEVF